MLEVDTDSTEPCKTEESPSKEEIKHDGMSKQEENAVVDLDIALFGNGKDEEVSVDQRGLIMQLFQRVSPLASKLSNDFCDHETCRRYLVARQWNLDKAEAQLLCTLKWRLKDDPGKLEFWQSPKALQDPYSLSMRIIGMDREGRPIAYTCFAEAHDRWDVPANLKHMMLLMEASCRLLKQRRQAGLNKTASSRQWVWVVDFDGFGWRDQNPKSASVTAKLMQHYPELLHLAVLIDAPKLFAGVFKLISPLLDERVRNKIMFQSSSEAQETLQERLGTEAADWIEAETKDNQEKRKAGIKKGYWIPPTSKGEHDARGISSYVGSPFYIKTPGDAYLEKQLE